MLESEKKLVAERKTRTRYSAAFKLAAVEKVVRNLHRPFQSLATEIGVSYSALYSWYNKYKKSELIMSSENPCAVLTEQELFFVRETIGSKESDKARYCRQHGIAYEKLKEWTELYKDERYQMVSKEVDEVEDNNKRVINKLNQEVHELKKQLRKSEKEKKSALALLELKKKVDQLCVDMKLDEEN